MFEEKKTEWLRIADSLKPTLRRETVRPISGLPDHALPENEYDSRTLFYKVNMRHVDVSDMKRGDLIFYRRPNTNIINHVAIYLGDGKVIESWPPAVTDQYSVTSYPHTLILGVARPFE